MKNLIAAVLVFLAIMIGVSLGKAAIQSTGEAPSVKAEQSASSEPTYMGVTRTEYLEVVSNNGQDKGSECAYAYLIDTYGLEATYKMDLRADKNIDDIDPAIFEAIERCM